MIKITSFIFVFALIAYSMADPLFGGLGLEGLDGGLGLGLDGKSGGLAGGFAVGRSISFGPGGVKTGGFGPIGGVIPLFGRRK